MGKKSFTQPGKSEKSTVYYSGNKGANRKMPVIFY